ncbi:hypothetical protein ABBQ32_001641 [Trebouxia sp. C0010 RCD-2024]
MADVEQAEQGEKPLTTADLLKSHTVKVIESHMASNYEESAVGIALEAAHKFKQYKDIASHVKHQFDKKYPGSGKASEGVFHCICGKSFATAISHETRYYIHLQVDTVHIVLFKSKDNPFSVSEA